MFCEHGTENDRTQQQQCDYTDRPYSLVSHHPSRNTVAIICRHIGWQCGHDFPNQYFMRVILILAVGGQLQLTTPAFRFALISFLLQEDWVVTGQLWRKPSKQPSSVFWRWWSRSVRWCYCFSHGGMEQRSGCVCLWIGEVHTLLVSRSVSLVCNSFASIVPHRDTWVSFSSFPDSFPVFDSFALARSGLFFKILWVLLSFSNCYFFAWTFAM